MICVVLPCPCVHEICVVDCFCSIAVCTQVSCFSYVCFFPLVQRSVEHETSCIHPRHPVILSWRSVLLGRFSVCFLGTPSHSHSFIFLLERGVLWYLGTFELPLNPTINPPSKTGHRKNGTFSCSNQLMFLFQELECFYLPHESNLLIYPSCTENLLESAMDSELEARRWKDQWIVVDGICEIFW